MQEDSESETENRVTPSPLPTHELTLTQERDEEEYEENWRLEKERRARAQRTNQLYIHKILSGTLHQMMIATLNSMPEEPTEFMKEYIRTHYTNDEDTPQPTPTETERAKMEERQLVGVKDLARLKAEIAELQATKSKFLAYKAAFTNMHKSLIDISATDFKAQEAFDPLVSFAKPTETTPRSGSKGSVAKRPAQITEQSDENSSMVESLEPFKQEDTIMSPKSSLMSTRIANPESISHWVERVTTFKEAFKEGKSEKKELGKTAKEKLSAYLEAEQDTLKHYFECVVELFHMVAATNGEKSGAGLIATALASTIPSLTELETPLTPENSTSQQTREKSLKQAMDLQQRLFNKIKVVKIAKGTKIYDLQSSYNVIITGTLIDMETEQEFNQFDVIADWPLQINIVDRSKPVDGLTPQQIAQVLE